MALFNLFKNSKSTPTKKADISKEIKRHQDDTAKADAQIAKLQKADERFEKDGDLNKRIAVYESVLDLSKPLLWNSFNYCLSLVKMYVEADRRDDAWRLLNQMTIAFARFPSPEYYTAKVRNEQFKILKKEKKYLDALRMLAVSHVLKTNSPQGSQFDTERFIKEAKTTAKGAGLSQQDLEDLAKMIKDAGKKKNLPEEKVLDIFKEFLKKKNI